MRLHVLVGFARHGRARGRYVNLYMVTPRFHLAAGTMPASAVGFVGHFLTLVKKLVVVHMGTV